MKPRLSEQLTLFGSIVKWSAYAAVVGVLAGGGTTLFLTMLSRSTSFAVTTPHDQYFLQRGCQVCSNGTQRAG